MKRMIYYSYAVSPTASRGPERRLPSSDGVAIFVATFKEKSVSESENKILKLIRFLSKNLDTARKK